jgi:polysaccharide export outer membrane protein
MRQAHEDGWAGLKLMGGFRSWGAAGLSLVLITAPLAAPSAAAPAAKQEPALQRLPAPDPSDLLGGQRPYTVGPFDRLAIDVFGVPELAVREVQADASGRISFPLVGVIEVLGLTPGEIEKRLIAKLREAHIRNPQVTVNLKETVSQVVTVYGEVKNPGQYSVIGGLSLLTVVARAGGTGEFAKLSNVIVYRTVKGQRYAAVYNLKAIKRGIYEDPELYPNDLVIVDESQARRIWRDVLKSAPLLVPAIVLLSR